MRALSAVAPSIFPDETRQGLERKCCEEQQMRDGLKRGIRLSLSQRELRLVGANDEPLGHSFSVESDWGRR